MANEAIDYINRDIVNVKKELDTLNKLVRDGNGQPSLIQQVTTLSNRVENLETNVHHEMCELKESFEEFKEAALTRSKLSWQFKTAILVALITSLTSIYINYTNLQAAENQQHVDRVTIEELNYKLDKILSQKK